MDWQFGVPATLAFAALVLVIGRRLIEGVAFLRKYSIPEPVVGGLLTAFLITLLHFGGIRLRFDTAFQPGLMLAFFATIGLGADARMLARGGIDVHVAKLGSFGHTMDGRAMTALQEQWKWLVRDDARWSAWLASH